jgi:hypothetical protein
MKGRFQALTVSIKLTIFWDAAPFNLVDTGQNFRGVITLMIEAVRTSETSVNIY